MNDIQDSNTSQPLEPIPTGLEPTGRLTGSLQCLLFDVYGTLLISGSGDVGTARQTIRQDERLQQLLLAYKVDRPFGKVLDDFFAAIAGRHARLRAGGVDYPEVKIDEIWMQVMGWRSRDKARSYALAFERIANPVYPMPGMLRLLEKTRARFSLGIISNAQFYTPLILENFFNAPLERAGFDQELLIFSYASECAKPSEHLFRLAKCRLEARGIMPGSVLYVGNDMLNDILPAQKTGFQTALFAGDKRSLRLRQNDERCKNVQPDVVITDLAQLLDHIAA